MKKKIFWSILVIVMLIGLDHRLLIRNYQFDAEEITDSVRIVLITDLHSCWYGKNQQNLLNAVDEQKPDLIALSGDIFDERLTSEHSNTVIADITEKYPCYYVTGNHEYYCPTDRFEEDMQFLEDHGVHILSGEMEVIEIHQQKINLCGVDDADRGQIDQQLKTVDALAQNGNYSILLSHRPELFPEYQHFDFDLILCGHAHGGQWRIPFLLNGLYAPDQGIFPKYAGGEYQSEYSAMIVSRGLARESTGIPRFYNRPELVVIDLY